MRFTDKVVVITGAAQGIGRQTAEQAAAEGAALLLIDRSSYVHELAATLAQSGCLVLALEADLEAWESTEQAFAAGVAHFGRIDVLINNAQASASGIPLAIQTKDHFDLGMYSGLYATFYYMRECYPYLKETQGSVINFASGAMDAEAGQRQHRQHFVGGDGGSESGAVLGGERRR